MNNVIKKIKRVEWEGIFFNLLLFSVIVVLPLGSAIWLLSVA